MHNKTVVRQQKQILRRDINSAKRREAADQAAKLLTTSILFEALQHVAVYAALSYEFDCLPIMAALIAANKQYYLPITQSQLGVLQFARCQTDTVLIKNPWQILEPVPPHEFIAIEALDLIVVPTVAFNLQGYRIGSGGGYYDKTLAKIAEQKRPFCLGLAFDCQQSAWQPDPWDIALDAILTETQLKFFSTRHSDDE